MYALVEDKYRKNMKVLHYIPSIDQTSGGVGSYLKLLASSLGKLVELHVVSHHSPNELYIPNCKIHYIDNGLMNLFKTKRQYQELLKKIQPDIIHVNACWEPLCSFTVFWAKQMGYPVVLSPHGMLEPWVLAKNHWKKKIPALVLYQKKSLKLADAIISTALSEKNNLFNLGVNSNVELVPNGININEASLKKSWKRSKTILYMGLLRPNKGAGILIQAISLIKSQLEGYKVIIAGPDVEGYMAVLQDERQKLGLKNLVEFTGGVYGDAKWELYKQADVFVLPTLNENFGIVIAEALLCGTPVITCKGAPWKELIDEKCGWWVDRDVNEIANAIIECLKLDENELEHMGRRGRIYVENNFSSDIVASKMLGIYEKYSKK